MKINLDYEFRIGPQSYTVIWTNLFEDDLVPDPAEPDKIRVYLPSVVMHEFGHTLGLADLYLDEYNGHYDGYLMADTYSFDVIPDEDIRYAHQVYRNRHGAKAH